VRGEILAGRIAACHDLADGGALIALAEMALAGDTGITVEPGGDAAIWFGEDQGRYILATADSAGLLGRAAAAGVPAQRIGASGGALLTLPDGDTISLAELRRLHEAFLPGWMYGAS